MIVIRLSVILVLVASCAPRQERETRAQVLSIVPSVSRFRANMLTVTVRSADGLVGRASVDTRVLRCHV